MKTVLKNKVITNKINKEKGFITIFFLSFFLIFFTLSFIIYIYYNFQKFYIKKEVKNTIKNVILKSIFYDKENDNWYFESIEGKKDILYPNDEELNSYISEKIKTDFITKFNNKNNNSFNFGMIKIIAMEEKYNIYGLSRDKNMVQIIESENYIGVSSVIEKINFGVNNENMESIEINELNQIEQLIDSALKIRINIKIKMAYPLFLFTESIAGDEFIRNDGKIIKRAIFDIFYVITI